MKPKEWVYDQALDYVEYKRVLNYLNNKYPNIYLNYISGNQLYFRNRSEYKLLYNSYEIESIENNINIRLNLEIKLNKSISEKEVIINNIYYIINNKQTLTTYNLYKI